MLMLANGPTPRVWPPSPDKVGERRKVEKKKGRRIIEVKEHEKEREGVRNGEPGKGNGK